MPSLSLTLKKVTLELLNPQGCALMCSPLVPQGVSLDSLSLPLPLWFNLP